eukprot:gnl/MRDRNA2_/MRDRNA2_105047_c0_seq1.p1 gnl/MRDRNA2_/MRDRNA2_105047_c0~~gnl/MRDRNA2_/MRDRNA2_105047_c0_seq1.p1  ORF type:complete len:727 (+),score=103.21 gnl/MRDRNA2_/MRDRNA2_105047_c0_seq1:181-2361(+)
MGHVALGIVVAFILQAHARERSVKPSPDLRIAMDKLVGKMVNKLQFGKVRRRPHPCRVPYHPQCPPIVASEYGPRMLKIPESIVQSPEMQRARAEFRHFMIHRMNSTLDKDELRMRHLQQTAEREAVRAYTAAQQTRESVEKVVAAIRQQRRSNATASKGMAATVSREARDSPRFKKLMAATNSTPQARLRSRHAAQLKELETTETPQALEASKSIGSMTEVTELSPVDRSRSQFGARSEENGHDVTGVSSLSSHSRSISRSRSVSREKDVHPAEAWAARAQKKKAKAASLAMEARRAVIRAQKEWETVWSRKAISMTSMDRDGALKAASAVEATRAAATKAKSWAVKAVQYASLLQKLGFAPTEDSEIAIPSPSNDGLAGSAVSQQHSQVQSTSTPCTPKRLTGHESARTKSLRTPGSTSRIGGEITPGTTGDTPGTAHCIADESVFLDDSIPVRPGSTPGTPRRVAAGGVREAMSSEMSQRIAEGSPFISRIAESISEGLSTGRLPEAFTRSAYTPPRLAAGAMSEATIIGTPRRVAEGISLQGSAPDSPHTPQRKRLSPHTPERDQSPFGMFAHSRFVDAQHERQRQRQRELEQLRERLGEHDQLSNRGEPQTPLAGRDLQARNVPRSVSPSTRAAPGKLPNALPAEMRTDAGDRVIPYLPGEDRLPFIDPKWPPLLQTFNSQKQTPKGKLKEYNPHVPTYRIPNIPGVPIQWDHSHIHGVHN